MGDVSFSMAMWVPDLSRSGVSAREMLNPMPGPVSVNSSSGELQAATVVYGAQCVQNHRWRLQLTPRHGSLPCTTQEAMLPQHHTTWELFT